MRKTILGKELYETALYKITGVVKHAIDANTWLLAKEANIEARGIAYAIWTQGQITDEELDIVVQHYWVNKELIDKHFANIKK